MGKVSRSILLSGAFHVRWPTIYNARYLSSFAYRLSGEHLSIIKRRYLSLSTYEPYGPLSMRLSSGCLWGDVFQGGKKCYENPSRIAEIPIAPLSRGTRQVFFRFSTWTGLSTGPVVILGGPRWLSEEFAVVEVRSVWSLKKTLRSHRTKRNGEEGTSSIVAPWRGEREKERERWTETREDCGMTPEEKGFLSFSSRGS